MKTVRFIQRRMLWGGGGLAAYGLWVAAARLPRDLPAGAGMLAAAWSLAVFAAAGMVLAAAVCGFAWLGTRPVPARWRPHAGAIVETILIVPPLTWLLLNEFIYTTTSEVFGVDAFLLVWHNTAAVFENAWRMGARYLVITAVFAVAVSVLVYAVSLRSFRRLQRRPATERTSSAARQAWPLAVLTLGLPTAVAGLFAWECRERPGEAMLALLRAAPALRAMNLAPALAGLDLTGPPPSFGPPILSDADYRARMGRPRTPPPNVIFILLESVSAKALHCYGYPRADITPNMDALAADGTRFAHCLGAASFSVCGLTSAMTSLYMLRGERFDHFTDTSFPHMGFPRALKLAGYQLALFSSGNESFDNISRFYPPSDFDKYFSHDTCDIPKTDSMRMDDTHAVGEFEKWLAARTDPRPLYCHFYLQSTHFNYEVPEPWASHYRPVPPLYSNGDGILHIPPEVLPKLRNQYDNALRYVDHWVGRIRSALERKGLFDNSIVVVIADHGEAFMEHGLARHGVHVWEEMIHIPWIVHVGRTTRASLPHAPPPLVYGTVSNLDVAPTIAGLVGIEAHPSWQGVDVLAPGYTGRDRPLYSMTQYTRWQELVCINRLKYVYDLTDVRESLFNLGDDPAETRDLSTERPDLVTILRELLAGWHTHQLRYYAPANRPFTRYIGRYEPDADLLACLHAAHASGAPR